MLDLIQNWQIDESGIYKNMLQMIFTTKIFRFLTRKSPARKTKIMQGLCIIKTKQVRINYSGGYLEVNEK